MPRIGVGAAGIACAEAGGGQPVVLLHGSASSAAQWRGLTRGLEDRFRVITPDLHGHGRSDAWPGPGPMTLADEVAIVAALADRAGGPVHLVGHSYGAAVALRFAQAHPERLRSLTLVEPVAFHLLREAGPACGAMLAEVEGVAAAVARAAEGSGAGMARFVDFWGGDGALGPHAGRAPGRGGTPRRRGGRALRRGPGRADAAGRLPPRRGPRPGRLRHRDAGADAPHRRGVGPGAAAGAGVAGARGGPQPGERGISDHATSISA